IRPAVGTHRERGEDRSGGRTGMRELVYIGQQSWLVRYGSANILVDPVLGETFGSSENLRFRIVPSRSVDIQRMPRIDAVVLTNEHIGHLDFPSLNGLPREVPVLVP